MPVGWQRKLLDLEAVNALGRWVMSSRCFLPRGMCSAVVCFPPLGFWYHHRFTAPFHFTFATATSQNHPKIAIEKIPLRHTWKPTQTEMHCGGTTTTVKKPPDTSKYQRAEAPFGCHELRKLLRFAAVGERQWASGIELLANLDETVEQEDSEGFRYNITDTTLAA